MKRLFASLLIAAVGLAQPGPAAANEGGGRDTVEMAVNRIAL